MKETLKKMSDKGIVELLQGTSPLNNARRQFSNWSAKIEQAGQQRKPLDPATMRRMEFEAVIDIAKALGLVAPYDQAAPKLTPKALKVE